MRSDPHSRNLRRHRILGSEVTYSVRTSTRARAPVLGEAAAKEIIAALSWLRSHERIHLHAFVVMPDHVHVLLTIRLGHVLPDVMKSLKSFTAKQINALLGASGELWQDAYYEHAIRDEHEAENALNYIVQNPVKAGFVSRPEEYWASSAHPDHAGLLDPVA